MQEIMGYSFNRTEGGRYGSPKCLGCKERTGTCHSTCKSYLKYRENLEAQKDAEKHYNASGNFHTDIYRDITKGDH